METMDSIEISHEKKKIMSGGGEREREGGREGGKKKKEEEEEERKRRRKEIDRTLKRLAVHDQLSSSLTRNAPPC